MRVASVLRRCCRLLKPSLLDQFLQLTAVGGDKGFFQIAALEFHRDIVVVGADKTVPALKMGDLHHLGFGKMKDVLNTLRFFIFQIQDDFGFAVVDDTLAVFPALQGEKVVEILGGADGPIPHSPV